VKIMSEAQCISHEEKVLELWEKTLGLSGWKRDDALLMDRGTGGTLGERNKALIALRGMLFDHAWPLKSTCPACATDCEFQVACIDLIRELSQTDRPDGQPLTWGGQRIAARAPTIEDVRAISRHTDAASAQRALVQRCLPDCLLPEEMTEDDFELLSDHIEKLDPAAIVRFAIACPNCAHEWQAPLDAGESLAMEVQRAAEQTLVEIASLARAFGWSEREVLDLPRVRRTAYLQLAGAI
jgi:hypothetical protein